MSYTPIDVNQMRSQLLTVDALREKLEPTETLSEYKFDTDGSDNVTFNFPENWNTGLENLDGLTVTTATVDINGTEVPLTKEAALDAASMVGVQKSHALNTPGDLITPDINWHYKNGGNGHKSLKLLTGRDAGLAFTRGTVNPFSNIAILDAAIEGIQDRYNTDDVLVDYKFSHDLDKTSMRLIVPSHRRPISSARAARGLEDPWSVGLDITNSLTGAHSLELSGYLFAWWCTNGCTMEHASSGKYRRKPSLPATDAYDWARNVVDDVFRDLENEFQYIEQLTRIPLDGDIVSTLDNVFSTLDIPANVRETVLNNLAESDDLTAYGLLNSVTSVANDPVVGANAAAKLLNAGGQIAHIMSGRCESCHRFG